MRVIEKATIELASLVLKENYRKNLENPIVYKPLSKALYDTWKYIDNIEKRRKPDEIYN